MGLLNCTTITVGGEGRRKRERETEREKTGKEGAERKPIKSKANENQQCF